MDILWLNWKDLKNPSSGGAEVFTHEVARRLVLHNKHRITLFTSKYKDCLSVETIDNVRVVREGNKYTVYKHAKQYCKANESRFDLIIDEINTRPFMTPRYVKDISKVVPLIHQLAREFWFYEVQFPLNYLGYYYLENKWLSYYKHLHVLTVSESTKQDLVGLAFNKVTIIPQGLNVVPLERVPEKDSSPTIVFLGRLKKAKKPDDALKAFSIIKNRLPKAKMSVIGDGYMLAELKKSTAEGVTFYGRVNDDLKYSLIKRAHVILVPAVREGWGMAVTEANAMGTPAVAYNVHGLRDSVIDQITGSLVKENSPEVLARTAISLLEDGERLQELSSKALEFSRNFSWERTTQKFEEAISSTH